MHRNLAIGLGLVLVMLVADYCEAGPFSRIRARRYQRDFIAIPADTIVTTSQQTSEIQQAEAIESTQETTQVAEESSGNWVRQRSTSGRRGFRGRRQRFVWIEQSQPTQSEETIISPNTEDNSRVEQATAIEPIETEEIATQNEIIEEPISQRRTQRRRYARPRIGWRRGYRQF